VVTKSLCGVARTVVVNTRKCAHPPPTLRLYPPLIVCPLVEGLARHLEQRFFELPLAIIERDHHAALLVRVAQVVSSPSTRRSAAASTTATGACSSTTLAGRRLSNDDAASAAAFLAHAGLRNSTTESRSCTRGTHSTRRDACINGVWTERRASCSQLSVAHTVPKLFVPYRTVVELVVAAQLELTHLPGGMKLATNLLMSHQAHVCTSSERFGEEGMFVKRRFMVLA
jgi:hypothetical protein